MEAIRKVYKRLPDILKMPKELLYRRVEVILLPLDEEAPTDRVSAATSFQLARFAGGWEGDALVREDEGEYEAREELK